MYDWNTARVPNWRGAFPVKVVDETLRDGLQNATAVDPPLAAKIELLERMARIGVDVVSVGLPAASQRSREEAVVLCAAIRDRRLPLRPTAAARTVANDVLAVAEVQQKTGVEVEAYAFIGSSPIRHFAENWDTAFLLKHVTEAANAAAKERVPFTLVTEDTTRARPEILEQLFKAALGAGAARLCLCDTVGHATPDGVARLVRFTKDLLVATGHEDVGLDWHAHNDRGLALQTALWASEFGVERVHGTALGIGERVGNVPLELLVLNLGLLGAKPQPRREDLRAYCARAAEALEVGGIPDTHPLFGKAARSEDDAYAQDAFRTEEPGGSAAPPPRLSLEPFRVGSPPAGRARPPRRVPLTVKINGDRVETACAPERTLLELLRYDLDLIGTKQGCDKGDCGACTVRIDGKPVLSCLTLALDCAERDVLTVEALPGGDDLHPLLDAFDRTGAAQCGFCTPGFLMSAWALLEENPAPTRDEIKVAVSSNLCRCTGYKSIFDAIELAAKMQRGEEPRMAGLPGRENLPAPIHDPDLKRGGG